MNLDKLATETRNQATMNLDQLSPLAIITQMNQEDNQVIKAVHLVLPQIAEAVSAIVDRLKKGGRLFYMGAGTSGRLGVLDAAECVPTFGTDPELVQGLIAGGMSAMTVAVEGAEDSIALGKSDLQDHQLTHNDTVVGIAASGRTPYVIGGLDYATEVGAMTIALACNQKAVISEHAQIKIEVVPGPEVLTGSTRLKAGTAQKMVLNMLSTASMVGIGKTYGNLMVDVKPTNEKLVARAEQMIMTVTGVNEAQASKTLKEANESVKLAIVMIETGLSAAQATEKLVASDGFVRQAIK